MAVSNYECISVGHNNGVGHFNSPGGVRVCIYKNYVDILEEDALLVTMASGLVRTRDVCVFASRAPDSGVFVLAWHDANKPFFAGIGVYGKVFKSDVRICGKRLIRAVKNEYDAFNSLYIDMPEVTEGMWKQLIEQAGD
jgi:hypothetical protein